MTLADRFIARVTRRAPDFVIGGAARPYLRRWWVIPRNPLFNIYLHQFLRSDDDRALHDHPWVNASILLRGRCVEHTISAGGIEHRRELRAGDVRVRPSGRLAHRVEVVDGPCWTLFITGPAGFTGRSSPRQTISVPWAEGATNDHGNEYHASTDQRHAERGETTRRPARLDQARPLLRAHR
jgi:hypothetical protein